MMMLARKKGKTSSENIEFKFERCRRATSDRVGEG